MLQHFSLRLMYSCPIAIGRRLGDQVIEAGGADRFNGEHQPRWLIGRVHSADGATCVRVVSALIRELGAKMGATGLRMTQKPDKIVNPLSTE